jgi:isoleucyl-tRNA synthetase
MFENLNSKVSFPELEEKILKMWDKKEVFDKSLEQTKGSKEYVFYDGPPFATGLPHYGHFVPGILKDIVPRFKTMQGYYVERKWGWDCHGLPVEYEMEKELGLKTKKDILNYGVDNFNEKCRSIVLRYTNEWEKIIKRTGRWVDFKNAYRTMDLYYMESIWAIFKSLWDKGLIYESYMILPYCTRCATPLSNFEVNQGYQDVKDPAITIKFKLKGFENRFILAWTTTPWTLPSNLALAVGEDIDYLLVKDKNGEEYILAKERISHYYKEKNEYEVLKELKGKEIYGLSYEPLFPYFKDISEKAFKILIADFVSTEDGTGIVHIAPGFGEDDNRLGKSAGLPIICPVDENGEFTNEVFDYKGIHVKDSDPLIIERLKNEGKLVKKEKIEHSYPHCWRCDSPLIYKAISTWFVKVEEIKDSLLKANEKINWIPEHIKYGRFGKWLEGARDWAISRNRFWGTPLPVWKCDSCSNVECIGSISELENKTGKKVEDIHKHYVDKFTYKCPKCGGQMHRIEEVLDCWFESGSMPYAQQHWPFENLEKFNKHFPADFIAEGLDQTRGWFYTLTVIAAALFDSPAFKNCIVNGLVLAEDGKKMSKRLKNYPEPTYIMDTYGADALRLYLVDSAVIRAEELRFSENGVKEIVKNILIPLWNAYIFLGTYAKIDNWKPEINFEEIIKNKKFENELDRWIISLLQSLIKEVTNALEEYKIYKAIPAIEKFLDYLTNWYIRRSRRRFWKSENDIDKNDAYLTLYYVLLNFSKVIAPIVPFISDEIYQNLKMEKMPISIHLNSYPVYIEKLIDKELENKMELVKNVVYLGRSLRTANNIKIRQPLKKMYVVNPDKKELEIIKMMDSLIKEELNIKEIEYDEDESNMVHLFAKPNYRKVGKILGQNIKKFENALKNLSSSDIIKLQKGATLEVKDGDFTYNTSFDDITVYREEKPDLKIVNEGKITIGLDLELNEELIKEGFARELVNKIQNIRKDINYNVVDRIETRIYSNKDLFEKIKGYEEYIKSETLTKELYLFDISELKDKNGLETWDINGIEAYIITKKL